MKSFKSLYSKFLEQNKDKLHFAPHSHHYWPDITREAQLEYWDDSAKYVDDKWEYFFTHKIPQTQKLIADTLNLSYPEQIVFAPNTHEFITRLLSCLPQKKQIKILTTNSEFYSFNRQIDRLNEEELFSIKKIPTNPIKDFQRAFINEINNTQYDFIFFSQVFFNSGFALENFNQIIDSINYNPIIVMDGYHGFMAIPTDLKKIEDRCFYISGSYKYAQGGEGCCFMHIPKNCELRPINTGWFARLDQLGSEEDRVTYSNNGMRFAGSTIDFSPLYRLHASMNLFKEKEITISIIHEHVQRLQNKFLEQLKTIHHTELNLNNLLFNDLKHHGHFLTFQLKNNSITKALHLRLKEAGIITDYRSNKIRFGFSIYQDQSDIKKCIEIIKKKSSS